MNWGSAWFYDFDAFRFVEDDGCVECSSTGIADFDVAETHVDAEQYFSIGLRNVQFLIEVFLTWLSSAKCLDDLFFEFWSHRPVFLWCKLDICWSITRNNTLMLFKIDPYYFACQQIHAFSQLSLDMEVATLLSPRLNIVKIAFFIYFCDDHSRLREFVV